MSKTKPKAAAEAPAAAADDRCYVTVVRTRKRCGKSATLFDGKIEFESAGTVIAGTARTVYVPTVQALADVLGSLTDHDYVIPDFVPAMIGEPEFEIVAKAEYEAQFGDDSGKPRRVNINDNNDGPYLVALCSTPGVWEFGDWRVLDRDVDEHTPEAFRVPYSDWLQLAARLVPGLIDAPRVTMPSSKSRVVTSDGQSLPSMNSHTWVLTTSGKNSNTLRSQWRVQAVEQDLAWHKQKLSRKTGEPLPGCGMFNTIFDLMVFTIHRQVYAGAPTIGAGLTLKPAELIVHEGTAPVNLADVPSLTASQVRAYGIRMNVRASLDKDGRMHTTDRTQMVLKSDLELEGGRHMTVADFLRDEKVKAGTKYRCQAMFRASDSMNGVIRKFDDHRVMHYDNGTDTTYWLAQPDWQLAAERFKKADDPEEAILPFGRALARMTDATYQIQRKRIKEAAGVDSVVMLDTIRAAGKASIQNDDALEFAARLSADVDATKATRHAADIAALDDGYEILTQLRAHWHLLLGSASADAVTFFDDSLNPKTTLLNFYQYKLASLRKFCERFPIWCNLEPQNPVDLWTRNPSASGVRRITFEPGLESNIPGMLNLWTGFAVEPDDPNNCPLFLKHVLEVIAGGDQKIAEYVMNWLALRVQGIKKRGNGPLARMNVALVLRSIPGTGKGLFERYVHALFGSAHAAITARGDGLTDRFNWQFARMVLLCADEAFFAGSHQQHDRLKAFLTDPVFDFEKKFADAVSLPNYCAVIMSTNKSWAVPADAGDRRMCVLDVSETHVGDRAYFNGLVHEMEHDGPSALMGFLMARDISQFDVNKYPRTAALEEQQILTIGRDDPVAAWLDEALETGYYVYGDRSKDDSHIATWPTDHALTMEREMMTGIIRDWTIAGKVYRAPTPNQIGRSLKKMVGAGGYRPRQERLAMEAEAAAKSNAAIAAGEKNKPFVPTEAKRARHWVLPPLSIARLRFDEYLRKGRWTTAWDGDED